MNINTQFFHVNSASLFKLGSSGDAQMGKKSVDFFEVTYVI